MQNFATYKAFWPFYVSEHQNKKNRNIHFLGTGVSLFFTLLFFVTFNVGFLFFAPIFSYLCAWFGHYFYEKNQPSTFRYFLWSFIADYQMFFLMCVGKMDREVNRMGILNHDN